MIRETVDSRYIGAISFVDVTTRLPLDVPLRVESRGVRLFRNRSSLYVIQSAPDFRAYTENFQDAIVVAPRTLSFTVQDPGGRYMPRLFEMQLPRDPSPAAPAATSLFAPLVVEMFPSATIRVETNWAVVRVMAANQNGDPLTGALLRMMQGARIRARGLTDEFGEGVLIAIDIPLITPANNGNAVGESGVDVIVEAFFDPAAEGSANPTDLEARRGALATSATPAFRLRPGQEVARSLVVQTP